jgi:DtxR family Mn-dependent transcriptional regulator
MIENLTPSIQDYLKQIYKLNQAGGSAATTELAERLSVAPASVTGMLQRMAASTPPLVIYQKHQGVRLTEAGECAALEVIRHHRLLETFMVSRLGYAWDAVHEDACRLEHAISEDFEARIADALGNPVRDPHGELIPTPDLIMPIDHSQPLAGLRPDDTATVRRVSAEEPALLRYLSQIGLVPDTRLRVTGYSAFDGNLTLQLDGQAENMVLGPTVTSQVFVEFQTTGSEREKR